MIDIVDALDLLNSCVRDRGEDYRSPALDESTASASWRYDAGRAVTDDIVTRAVASAATPTTTGSWLIRRSVVDAYASGQNPFNLTLGAVIVLRAAELTGTIPRSDGKPQGSPTTATRCTSSTATMGPAKRTARAFGSGWFALSSNGRAVSGTGSNSGGGGSGY